MKGNEVPAHEVTLLEGFIESYGIEMTLGVLGEICTKKATIAAEEWQDTTLAKLWAKRAGKIAELITNI